MDNGGITDDVISYCNFQLYGLPQPFLYTQMELY